MPQRIRDAQVAEEIAAQAGTEATPDLFLSDFLSPVIFGPQRPPLASSGYFPGCMGFSVTAVALNTSHFGIFVSGVLSNAIAKVNSVSIQNSSGGALDYTIRRLDSSTGFVLAGVAPGYISATPVIAGGIFSATKSDTVAAVGTEMAEVEVADGALEKFDGPWIINNGLLLVACKTVNREVRAYFNFEVWPSIRQQPMPG